jgi:hypothetical protein
VSVRARGFTRAFGVAVGALVVVQVALSVLNLGLRLPPHTESPWFPLLLALMPAAWAAVGALVASRRPENPIGWLFCGVALATGVMGACYAYSLYALYGPGGLPGGRAAGWAAAWLPGPAAFFGPLLLFIVFPDGHFLSRRWLVATVALLLVGVVGLTSDALRPDLFHDALPGFSNPLGVSGGAGRVVSTIDDVGSTLSSPLVFLLATASLVVRFRRAGPTEREQIKWVAFAAAFTAVAVPVAVASGDGSLAYVMWAIVLLGLLGLPVAAGLAILRYRLYEIDRVINRTLVYGSLTICLAAAYLAAVLLFQAVLGGLTRGSGLAVAVSTLAVAGLFRPARARIQGGVDRRFYRRKYDAARTLEGFSARLREEVDLDAVGGELRTVVSETMQPAHVSLWLRAP